MNRASRRRAERNRPMAQPPTPRDGRAPLINLDALPQQANALALPLGMVMHKRRPGSQTSWCNFPLDGTLSHADLWSDVTCPECKLSYVNELGTMPVDTPIPPATGQQVSLPPMMVVIPVNMAVDIIRDFFEFAGIGNEEFMRAGLGSNAIEYWIQEYANARRQPTSR